MTAKVLLRSDRVPAFLIACFLVVMSLPRPEQCYVMLAHVARCAGFDRLAIDLYHNATLKNESCLEAWFNLSSVLAAHGDLTHAKMACTAAMSSQPPDVETFCRLVVLSELLSATPSTSVERYRKALTLSADDGDGWFRFGMQLQAAGDVKGAELAFKRVTDLQPDSAESWLCLGNASFDPNSAIAAYNRALRIKPEFSEAWYALGKSLLGIDNQAAAAALSKAINLAPSYVDAWHELGNARRCSGDEFGAAQAFSQSERLGWKARM